MKLWALGTQYLGMTDCEWRQLTPRHFIARLELQRERDEASERREDLRAGVIAAEVRNTIRNKTSDRIWSAFDFFPSDESSDTAECDVEGIVGMFRGLTPGRN